LPWLSPDFFHFPLTFSIFPDFSLTTLEFPDFSRFSRWVVTLVNVESSTKMPPFELLYGVKAKLPVDLDDPDCAVEEGTAMEEARLTHIQQLGESLLATASHTSGFCHTHSLCSADYLMYIIQRPFLRDTHTIKEFNYLCTRVSFIDNHYCS